MIKPIHETPLQTWLTFSYQIAPTTQSPNHYSPSPTRFHFHFHSRFHFHFALATPHLKHL